MKRKSRRGTVLIVVLGVLAVLSLLALTFMHVQGLERQISRNQLDAVRVRLIAQAGIEHAIAELRQLPQQNLIPGEGPEPWRYWGNDVAEDGTGDSTVSLAVALNPSFAREEDGKPASGSPKPATVMIDSKPRGYSGVMEGGSRAANSDIFFLKVTDASGKIFVNEGLTHYQANDSTASQNLRRILNRLGEALKPPVSELGTRILSSRPAVGYRSIDQLDGILPREEYDRVKDFLTAHAWIDSNVANPVPLTAAHAQSIKAEFGIEYYRGNPPIYRCGRGKDEFGYLFTDSKSNVSKDCWFLKAYPAAPANSLQHSVYAMDELNPQWIEITSRAPVNVNAASKEVLIALLTDLRGVFMSERRRDNIANAGGYHLICVKHTSSPAPMVPPYWRNYGYYAVPEGDEHSFLYETYPIVGPNSTTPGISATAIADEIIACRQKKKSPAGNDYATLAFGGPFRTWHQFNAFCDNLVQRWGQAQSPSKILFDKRPIFFDTVPDGSAWSTGNITGHGALTFSPFQQEIASQAIADVLKANFNPNLHLNELNPDRNLFQFVDKTDLMVNSTEFIFTPTGYYDIESIGRVLAPGSGGKDCLAPEADNTIIAEAEIRAGVKLFDMIRETNQNQFYQGSCSNTTVVTNSGMSLEVGPEPDNGAGPVENRWSGYIALPTLGGDGAPKAPLGAPPVPTRPVATPDRGETIHAHLSRDFDAHYHRDNINKDLGSNTINGDTVTNFPDPDPPGAPKANPPGPYDPVDNGGSYYRLARWFSLPKASASGSSGTSTVPPLLPRSPLDLRIDGGYFERHNGLAYWISTASYVPNVYALAGTCSFWIKPNFFPERSGKPRLLFDMSRVAPPAWGWYKDAQFFLMWNACHDVLPGYASPQEYATSAGEQGPHYGVNPLKPQSLLFGVGYGGSSGTWGGTLYHHWMQTASLNHIGHGHNAASYFKGHEWMHVTLVWKRARFTQYNWINVPSSWNDPSYEVYVDGKMLNGTLVGQYGPHGWGEQNNDWTRHTNNQQNSVRFGTVSNVTTEGPMAMNFSPDSTMDEIYFWNSPDMRRADQQWTQGRYSYPRGANEGIFTSREIDPMPTGNRSLPPPSAATPPETAPVVPQQDAAASVGARLLGMTWTWYGEVWEQASGRRYGRYLTNHNTGREFVPAVEASIPDLVPTNVTDDGYSPLRDSLGNSPVIQPGSKIKYRLTFKVNAGLLLTTPVVDDVTLYMSFDQGVFTYYRNVVSG